MMRMAELPKCPVCGTRAFVRHFIVAGSDFGWGAGCPSFYADDGVHGWSYGDPIEKSFSVHRCNTKQQAIDWWIERVKKYKKQEQEG